MTARAIWKASIICGEATVPVKLYSAVNDRSIHFHLLHDQDFVRVEQRMVNPQTNESVPYDEQLRGFEVERGVYVKFDAQELASLEPTASREINVAQFVPVESVDRAHFVRPYWLGPDGPDEAYFALAAAIAESEKIGVAKWVMRKKSYAGVLSVYDEHLLLTTLKSNAEIIAPAELEPPSGRELSKPEKQLAQQLVAALHDDFDSAKFRDEYRERVTALLKAKQRGEIVRTEAYVPRPKSTSLEKSLRSSLAALN